MDVLTIKTERKIMDNMVELGFVEKEWNEQENGYTYRITEDGKKVNKIFEDHKSAKIQRDIFGDFC